MQLADLAANMPMDRLAICGVGLAWTMAPLLTLDRSSQGQSDAAEVNALLSEAWASLEATADLRDLELRVGDRHELEGDELEAPAAYRSDVVEVLRLGLRSARTQDRKWLAASLGHAQDAIYFLQQDAGQTASDLGDGSLREVANWAASTPSISSYEADLGDVRQRIEALVVTASNVYGA